MGMCSIFLAPATYTGTSPVSRYHLPATPGGSDTSLPPWLPPASIPFSFQMQLKFCLPYKAYLVSSVIFFSLFGATPVALGEFFFLVSLMTLCILLQFSVSLTDSQYCSPSASEGRVQVAFLWSHRSV